MLTSSSGAKIPLSQVAEVKLTRGASSISREMNRRYIDLSLNLRGRDLTSFLKEAKTRIENEVEYDHETISIEWGGAVRKSKQGLHPIGHDSAIGISHHVHSAFHRFR